MGAFSAYGLPAAGAAAVSGVDAAGLANRLAIAYQEAEQRARRNDIEQGAMLYNMGDVQGAQRFLGAGQPLEDPIQRAVRMKQATEAAEEPKTLQHMLIRLLSGGAPGGAPSGIGPVGTTPQPTPGAPPPPPTAPPGSVTETRRTPVAGAQIQGPDQRAQQIIDLLMEKKLTEQDITARRLRAKMELAPESVTLQDKMEYIMSSHPNVKSPEEAVMFGVTTGMFDLEDPNVKTIFDAAITKLKTPGALGEAKLAAIMANLEKAYAQMELTRQSFGLKERETAVHERRADIEGSRATTEAKAKEAEAENRKQQRRQAFTSNLTRVQGDFEEAYRNALPGPQQEDVKRRFLQTIKSIFEAEISEEDDPGKKKALQQRMQTEMSKYRPALKLQY